MATANCLPATQKSPAISPCRAPRAAACTGVRASSTTAKTMASTTSRMCTRLPACLVCHVAASSTCVSSRSTTAQQASDPTSTAARPVARLVSTPISVGNGAWDVKIVLGEAKIHEDGSAMFRVPARTPVYFQAIDADGYAAQTMRSWSTLQPGECMSCVGCHEHKSMAPLAASGASYAMRRGPEPLRPFYGPARGFSFPKEIQPILDRNCVKCHRDRTWSAEAKDPVKPNADGKMFSLLGETRHDPYAERHWSDAYLNLLRAVRRERNGKRQAYCAEPGSWIDWAGSQSVPSMLPPYTAGAATSGLLKRLREGHHGVALTREELDKIACWIDLFVPYCGDYTESNAWNDEGQATYARFLAKRRQMAAAEQENIQSLLDRPQGKR